MGIGGLRRWASWLIGMLMGGIAMGEEVMELRAFEVEAWHFDTLAGLVPADVIRLEASEIEASGLTSVPEVLEQLGGVRFRGFTGSGAEGQVALRGFGDNSGLRALVLVDGLAYNPADMGGINWTGLEASELEVVEIVRGGQSVLYGNHALSGVIKLRTREPGAATEGRLRVSAGSFGMREAGGSLSGQAGPASLRAGGRYTEAEGYRDQSDSWSGLGYLSWKVSSDELGTWRGRLQAGRNYLRFPGPLSFEQMRENSRQSITSGNDESTTETVTATALGQGEAAFGGWEVTTGYLRRDREWELDGTFADNLQERWTLKPRVRLRGEGATLITGVDVSLDQLDGIDYLDREREVRRALADIGRLALGGYALISYDLNRDWQVSAGLRYETARTENDYVRFKEEQLLPEIVTNRGTFPNPDYRDPPEVDPELSFSGPVNKSGWAAEVSLVKSLRDDLTLWLGWDRVYRYPSLDETTSYQGYPLANPLNADLKPETGHNFEMGLKWIETRWHLGATVFMMRLQDEITYDESLLLNTNIGETIRKGVELESGYQGGKGGVTARLAYVSAKFDDRHPEFPGRLLPLVPEFTGTVNAWIALTTRVRLGMNLRYNASQIQGNDLPNTRRRIPAYALAGMNLSWRPGGGWTVSFAISNLFDRHYAETAYNGGFYPGEGRRGVFNVHYTY